MAESQPRPAPSGNLRLFGLTGGIASGKSTVANLLRNEGVPVVDADAIARDVVAPGTPGLEAIVLEFGGAVLLPDGSLNREEMGRMIYADANARQRLNALTHPMIRKEMAKEITEFAEAGANIIVVDVPLLFETGSPSAYHGVLVVYVDEKTQLQRLCQRDGFTLEQASARLRAQLPLSEKARRATTVFDNTGNKEETARQVLRWLDTVRSELRE